MVFDIAPASESSVSIGKTDFNTDSASVRIRRVARDETPVRAAPSRIARAMNGQRKRMPSVRVCSPQSVLPRMTPVLRRGIESFGQIANVLFEASLIRQRKPRAAARRRLRNRPRDRSLIGDTNNESVLAGEVCQGRLSSAASASLSGIRPASLSTGSSALS